MVQPISTVLVVLIMLCHAYTYGQGLQLSEMPNSSPVFQLLEVFSVNIHNSKGEAHHVYLKAKLFKDNGPLLFEGKSHSFDIAKNNRFTSIHLLNAGSYITPYETVFRHFSLPHTTTSLPVSDYKICISIFDNKENRLLAPELCYKRSLSPLGTPNPVTPFDDSELDSDFPIFSWTPPMGYVGGAVKYDFTLVEIIGNQSALAAIQSNPPVFSTQNINSSILQLPPYIKLKPCITYAWQVQIAGEKRSVNVPVSTFRKPCAETTVNKVPNSFVVLKKQVDGGYYIAQNGILKFKFVEEYYKNEQASLSYSIKNTTNDVTLGNSAAPPEIIAYGDNRYTIDFSTYLTANEFYFLEITDTKNQKYYLRFKCQYP